MSELMLTNYDGTLRCGGDTFDLQMPRRIAVDVWGKARVLPAN